jgi:hypothetical protein
MPALADWGSFYAIVASAAGTLIGLQFVAMTLIAERPPLRGHELGAAFASPTIVHFCAVLLLSALARVPWPTLACAAGAWGVLGLAGLAYIARVARRMRRQTAYRPDNEDWLFHLVLPLAAYAALVLAAFAAPRLIQAALFGVAAATLLLLFTGIHNVWDAVVYHVFVGRNDPGREQR